VYYNNFCKEYFAFVGILCKECGAVESRKSKVVSRQPALWNERSVFHRGGCEEGWHFVPFWKLEASGTLCLKGKKLEAGSWKLPPLRGWGLGIGRIG
jgi:hypothetical protein